MTKPFEKLTSCKSILSWFPFEGNDVLTRTSVLQTNKNNLYHVIIHAVSNTYKEHTTKGKQIFVEQFQNQIIKLVQDKWKEHSDTIRFYCFCYDKFINNFYKFINKDKINEHSNAKQQIKEILKEVLIDNKDYTVYNIITQIFTYDMFKKYIYHGICRNKKKNTYDEFINLFTRHNIKCFETCLNKLNIKDDNKIKLLLSKYKKLINIIKKYCKKLTIKNYIKTIKNNDISNSHKFKIIKDIIKKNIYIICSKTRLPIKAYKYNNKAKSIILLKFSDNYYENIGKLIESSIIKRIFLPTEILIDVIDGILYDNSKIIYEYPQYVRYLKLDKEEDKICKKIYNDSKNVSSQRDLATKETIKTKDLLEIKGIQDPVIKKTSSPTHTVDEVKNCNTVDTAPKLQVDIPPDNNTVSDINMSEDLSKEEISKKDDFDNSKPLELNENKNIDKDVRDSKHNCNKISSGDSVVSNSSCETDKVTDGYSQEKKEDNSSSLVSSNQSSDIEHESNDIDSVSSYSH